MKRSILPRIGPLAISVLVLLTLLVPLAYTTFPHIYHWRMMRGLLSNNDARLTQSLNYVAHRAKPFESEPDNAVRLGAAAKMRAADDEHFRLITTALEAAGCWDRQSVGDGVWLRWIGGVTASDDPTARLAACLELGKMADIGNDPRIIAMLRALQQDDTPDVRLNALIAAAEAAARSPDDAQLLDLIRHATRDSDPVIARHAWIFLGLLRHAELPPTYAGAIKMQTAEAMLWAVAVSHPDANGADLMALYGSAKAPQLQAAAAYALTYMPSEAAQLLPDHAQPGAPRIHASRRLWRAILGTSDTQRVRHWLDAADRGTDDQALLPLRLAACYRLGDPATLPTGFTEPTAPMFYLATVEGIRGQHLTQPIPDDAPLLLRVAATRAAANPSLDVLRPAFYSEVSTLRDIACLTAAARFQEEQLDPLIDELLLDYNDSAKISGALLAGITGLQPGLLRKRFEREDVPAVRIVQRLALWMQGDTDITNPQVTTSLLARDDLDIESSILLAMLHVGHRDPAAAVAALDYLLNPHGELGIDLVELFDKLRWWYVMETYLPILFEDPSPSFWLWADDQLQQFQVEVLRDWYLLQRWRLTRQTSRSAEALKALTTTRFALASKRSAAARS